MSGASLAFVSNKKPDQMLWSGFHTQRGDADSAICKMIEEGLTHSGKSVEDIDTIVVSHGPGSFTGIKVGLAWSYGFQAARKENLLYGLSSLAEGNKELKRRNSELHYVLVFPISRREAFLCWQNRQDHQDVFKPIVLHSLLVEEELRSLLLQGYTPLVIGSEDKIVKWFEQLGMRPHEMTMLEFMQVALQGMVKKAASLDLTTLKERIVFPQYLKKTTIEEKLSLGN
jgi:tRNA A37 threonylcarbamoyladenosine modification protein TsaB